MGKISHWWKIHTAPSSPAFPLLLCFSSLPSYTEMIYFPFWIVFNEHEFLLKDPSITAGGCSQLWGFYVPAFISSTFIINYFREYLSLYAEGWISKWGGAGLCVVGEFPGDRCMWLPSITLTFRMTEGTFFLPFLASQERTYWYLQWWKQLTKPGSFHLESIHNYPPVSLWIFHGRFSIPERFLFKRPILQGHSPLISQLLLREYQGHLISD